MHSAEKKLIIIGAGGAGAEALWVAQRSAALSPTEGWTVLGFADDAPALAGRSVAGAAVLGRVADVIARHSGCGVYFHCAIGNNRVRRTIAIMLEAAGFLPATLIDPSAVVASTAVVGAGSYVGPQSNVSPFAQVGRHVLINTQVSVGHHSGLGDFAQLCPGTRVSGNGLVGEGGFLGSNAVLAPGVRVGEWATVGAASFALKDVPDGATVVGNPARVVLR